MILCSSWWTMCNTSAGSWNRRQRNSMTQCLHCWWLLHSLFQRRWYRTWNRKNMKTTKISSYSDYLSTDPVGNKYHNTASSWSYCCALIVALFGPHSWWQDIRWTCNRKNSYQNFALNYQKVKEDIWRILIVKPFSSFCKRSILLWFKSQKVWMNSNRLHSY